MPLDLTSVEVLLESEILLTIEVLAAEVLSPAELLVAPQVEGAVESAAASRLVPHANVELQINAARRLRRALADHVTK